MKIVVVGGSGLIGAKVVFIAREAGHCVEEIDLHDHSSEIVDDAVNGADIVIDAVNSPTFEDGAAMAFFEASCLTLLPILENSNIKHYVALSIVGTERLPEIGYYRARHVREKLIAARAVPYTIVRTTQLLEFLPAFAEVYTNRGSTHIPTGQIQPIAADDVARLLLQIACAPALFGSVEIAGPERAPMCELVRRYLVKIGDPRTVVPDSAARYLGAAIGSHTLLPTATVLLGAINLDDWLLEPSSANRCNAITC